MRPFKNREFRVRIAKTTDNEEPTTTDDVLSPETIDLLTEAGKTVIKYAVLAFGVLYVAVKVTDTISEIAVKKTKSADKE